jgi:hypothetical protein
VSCLDATFTLTPLYPAYADPLNIQNFAFFECHGADFWANVDSNLSSDYASNRFFFDDSFASDTTLNYAQYTNLKKAKFLECGISLTGYRGDSKQLLLIFGFDVMYSWIPGRVQVYSSAGLLKDQQLVYGDNQFALEIDSLDQEVILYFIHAGGYWFFKGLSGYVV